MAELKRTLNLPLLVFYGTGMILGAGIYSIIGKAAGLAQEGLWISFLLASLAVSFTALSYAELSTLFPQTAAEYMYLKGAFPRARILAKICGLMMAFAGAATASTVSLAFGGQLQQFVPVAPQAAALTLLGLFTLVNISGIRESSWVNVIFTLIEVSGLFIVIYFGWQSPKFAEALSHTSTSGVVPAAALVVFAYFGFENIVNFVEESKNPEKNIPRAILISLILSTVLYVWVGLAALALLSPGELAKSQAPLADTLKKVSPRMTGILGGIALFSMANTALISLLTTARIFFGMAREGAIPRILCKVSPKRKTPWAGALLTFGVAALLTFLDQVEILAGVSSFATLMAFTGINLAVISLRYREPERKRPFRIPVQFGKLPLFPVLGALMSLIFLFQFEARIYGVGLAFVVFSLLISLRRWH